VRIRKRRIVERPRLFSLLDQSQARVRTLVGPAGYGKTTLAEQWVARDGRVGTWYTARSSSTDVAALALGIARSATSIVHDCDVRLRGHLRALPAPAENVETLAEILRMPYTLSRGTYVWPFAYDVASVDDLSAHERELLAPLGPLDTLFVPGAGYLGWRAGISADGNWTFFVAGD